MCIHPGLQLHLTGVVIQVNLAHVLAYVGLSETYSTKNLLVPINAKVRLSPPSILTVCP